MIHLEQYWMGRDRTHGAELTPEVTANAVVLVERINHVLACAAADDVCPEIHPETGTFVASGWRPRAVNDATPYAGRTSKHVIGCAVDLRDPSPQRALARWCLRNRTILEEVELWMEDPRWTPTWVHLQSIPPVSGNRVFVPSDTPPLVAALPEQHA